MIARPGVVLRDYQREALDAIGCAYEDGITRQLVALPTGSGKTVIFSELISRRAADGRALVLAHRDELVKQAVAKIADATGGTLPVGVVKAAEDEAAASVVVASVQTLARSKRLARLLKVGQRFGTVVVDEAHHSPAPTYRRILEAVGSLEGGGPLTVGFTATPMRADGKPLGDMWEAITFHRSILEMIGAGWLCGLKALSVGLKADLDALKVRGGDFADGELGELLKNAGAPEIVAATYIEQCEGRSALVFLPTREVARKTAAAFTASGVIVEYLDGETPPEERRAILARLRAGSTRVVVNVGVLTEGFDEPRVACVMVARPTKSKALYLQMIGRGTRPYPGKRDCLVVDFVGATERHDLATASFLFGNADTLPVGDEPFGYGKPLGVYRRNAVSAGAVRVSPVELLTRKPLAWLRLPGSGHLLLPISRHGGFFVVAPSRDESGRSSPYLFDVWQLYERDTPRTSTLHLALESVPLDVAQTEAEAAARDGGDKWLTDPKASWRKRRPSPRQRGYLEALGFKGEARRPDLSKGEASDLISAAKADSMFKRCAAGVIGRVA